MKKEKKPTATAQDTDKAKAIWRDVKKLLRQQMTQATYNTNFNTTALDHIEGQTWFVAVQNRYALEWITTLWVPRIQWALTSLVGHAEITLKFVLLDSQESNTVSSPTLLDSQESNNPQEHAFVRHIDFKNCGFNKAGRALTVWPNIGRSGGGLILTAAIIGLTACGNIYK